MGREHGAGGAGWVAGVLALVLLAACGSGAAPAAQTTMSAEQVGTYSGADRQAMLEAGARREGALLWYTTLIVNQAVRPLVDGFTRKYPYIKVDHYRADSGEVAQ